MIAEELRHFSVPHFMVRNKVDADIANNEDDHGIPADRTLASIEADMQRQGVRQSYLISSKFANREEFHLAQLKTDVILAICDARAVSGDWLRSPRSPTVGGS